MRERVSPVVADAFLQTSAAIRGKISAAGKERARTVTRASERVRLMTEAKSRMFLRFMVHNPLAGALKPLAEVISRAFLPF